VNARDRVQEALVRVSPMASPDEVRAAVEAALLPAEPTEAQTIVTVGTGEDLNVFLLEYDPASSTRWWRTLYGGTAGNVSAWAYVCSLGEPLEMRSIARLLKILADGEIPGIGDALRQRLLQELRLS
jgi:hypothetical protein